MCRGDNYAPGEAAGGDKQGAAKAPCVEKRQVMPREAQSHPAARALRTASGPLDSVDDYLP